MQEAAKTGTPLSASRLKNYHRLMQELAFEHEKAEIGLVRSERKRWKGIAKLAKEINKERGCNLGFWGVLVPARRTKKGAMVKRVSTAP